MPFLAQTEALCGGAAAAMVLRYWGDTSVSPAAFAPLVDSEKGGIVASALVDELRRRGHGAHPFRGTPELVRHHLEHGRPVIALIEVAPGRFHYVVLVAWHRDRVLLHDPARGPFQVETAVELARSWAGSDHWALVVLPAPAEAEPPPPSAHADPGPCGGLVDAAVRLARDGDEDEARLRLDAAVRLCPDTGRVHRERAALHFRAERWAEAAAEAERATRLSPGDEHGWRLLATSRFLAGRPDAALEAWNRVGEPVIDAVALEGLKRSRHDVLREWTGLPDEGPLRPGPLARARRRLEELPAAAAVRVSYRPLAGGRAQVEVAVVERPLLDPARALLPRLAADALVARRARLVLHGLGRRGGALEAGGRFWARRPAAWLTVTEPGALGLPGLVTAEVLWDRQTYAADAAERVETRRRGGLALADWATPSLRWEVALAGERWSDRGTSASLRAGADVRLAGDRVALRAAGARSTGSGGRPGFGSWRAAVAVRSARERARLVLRADASVQGASDAAPRGAWPGAGTGHARPLLLRGRPLLEDGVITGPAFGPRLLHAGAELELELLRLGPVRLGLAAFVDHARARPEPGTAWGPALVDAGAGLRLHLPGGRALRVDVATPLDGPGTTVSAGWLLPWPR